MPGAVECKRFSTQVLKWFDKHGRKHLPWQQCPDAYSVWVSEIMLQQTQVATVIPYYEKFMARFPAVEDLAAADQDEVLRLWSGLGYYARGRNLHKAARLVCSEYSGRIPSAIDELVALPGVGRSTAGAIRSLAFGKVASILDGNVKRVLCRHFAVDGWYGQASVQQYLWRISDVLTPVKRTGPFNQAMMDLGATLCTRSSPRCDSCPLKKSCKALASGTPTQWPHKRIRAEKPLRKTLMLLLEDSEGHVKLERRPATGIWGGLWCFPQFEQMNDLLSYARKNGEFENAQVVSWSEFTHTFSHFQLVITPVHIRLNLNRVSSVQEIDSSVWVSEGATPGGLPAPVTRLLNTLRESLV
ncbi:A/G-specific adenine glycosylase [Chromatiales bacterium (ex Bugula neritina AB1)]|nr:A/G-specific adenine glycosylase [Chromatiales bacterium (ex Bugula neritina AB1)]